MKNLRNAPKTEERRVYPGTWDDYEVDVIIPVYRPDDRFFTLLDRLAKQTVRPRRIILMNTEESLWDAADGNEKLRNTGAAELCEIHHLTKSEFDHGGTRNLGVSFSRSPYFVMMTQDAVPQDRYLLQILLGGMKGKVRMCYARQLAGRKADPIERFSRGFNYGPRSRVKTMADLPELGIKTWFASNVCAAYDRSVFDALGGFVDRTIFNEDMIYCAGLLKAGYAVRYCADARVIHFHHFTGRQQIQRNFDLAVSQAQHPEVFAGIISESEGIKMVWNAAKWLRKQGRMDLIPELVWTSGCKYLGYRLGKAYRKLPASLVKRISGNSSYWGAAKRPKADSGTGTAAQPESGTAGEKQDE